jgi:glycerophosphoryl diester phosphodiesterase
MEVLLMKHFRLAVVLLALHCASVSQAQWIVAHRGASYDAPENTLAAFREAFAQGADGVESDYYLSSDGEVVCIHDKDTKRVAGEKLLVKDASYEALRALDVGAWKGPQWRGERIPTLAEVLKTIPPGRKIVIELKIGPEIVAPLLEVLAKSDVSPDQVLIISFNTDAIAECERRMPELCTHWLTGYKQQKDGSFSPSIEEVTATIQKCHADGLGSEARTEYFDAKFIDQLRASGCRQFHVWTVDDPQVARFYQNLGARWITTNRPRWLREQITEPTSN